MVSETADVDRRRCCRRVPTRRICGAEWTLELGLTLEELMEDLDPGWADQLLDGRPSAGNCDRGQVAGGAS